MICEKCYHYKPCEGGYDAYSSEACHARISVGGVALRNTYKSRRINDIEHECAYFRGKDEKR
jgi:hypothetical protein